MSATQTLSPQIIEKPGMTIVGLQAPFIHVMSPDATNFKVIGPLWERFIHQAERIGNRIGEGMYGVLWTEPASKRSHPHEMQYLAGVMVSEAAEIPDGMVARTIPASLFAVFTHRGPIKTIGDTMHEIYRVWLPQSGYEHSQVVDVELYDRRFCPDGADSEMEYWISVRPKEK